MLTNSISKKAIRKIAVLSVASVFALSVMGFGQEGNSSQAPANQAPPSQVAPPDQAAPYPAPPDQAPPSPEAQYQAPPDQAPPDQPPAPGWHRFSTQPPQPGPPPAPMQAAPLPVPPQITIPAGTFVTVRVDQLLSSDKNKPGDAFAASLNQPLVANGLIVSRRGQMLAGKVVDAQKAGRVKGVSHLQITLTSLTLADGQQVPVHTELTSITGPTSNGRDAAAVGATTVTGAAIGGAAAWGPGAAIGAGAGLVAGVVGVLVTRGRSTVIYPESRLTFRLAAPVSFSTTAAPQAFLDARTAPIERSATQGPPPSGYVGAPGTYPPPYYYGPYPYPYYYPYWGPSFGIYVGPGFYGRGFYRR